MSTTADDSDSERWLEDISHNPNAPADDPGKVSEDWRRWMRGFFDANGAAPQAQVNRAAEEHLLALANNAAAAVLADLQSVTSLRPTVVVDIYDEGVRIAIDGSYSSPSMWEVAGPAAFAEVADYFQEQLDEECWPVCDDHNTGLHAEVRSGDAIWWCRVGNHGVASVGRLEERAV